MHWSASDDRVPSARWRRGRDGAQLCIGAEPAAGVEHETGHEPTLPMPVKGESQRDPLDRDTTLVPGKR